MIFDPALNRNNFHIISFFNLKNSSKVCVDDKIINKKIKKGIDSEEIT